MTGAATASRAACAVRMTAGVAFPDPAPPPPPGARRRPGPAAQARRRARRPLRAAAGRRRRHDRRPRHDPPPGTHIVAFEWDIDGDHHVDANTGTNPIFHLPAGSAAQTVIVTAIDSNFGSGSAATTITPGPSPSRCESEASIRILRIRAACITRTGQVTRAPERPPTATGTTT